MKTFRLSLYFLVGVLLGSIVTMVKAETIPATASTPESPVTEYVVNGVHFAYTDAGQDLACKAKYNNNYQRGANRGICYYGGGNYAGASTVSWCSAGNVAPVSGACPSTYSCPSGQNWTLSGSTCTRPDCTPPDVRNSSTGVCQSPCLSKASLPTSYMWHTSLKGVDNSGQRCDAGCMVTVALDTSEPSYYYTATTITMKMGTSYTGASCTVGGSVPSADPVPPAQPPTPPKKPLCSAGEGVLTSSSGTVACVPAGTPSAETPKIVTAKTTDTYSDGSQKITTQTTTEAPSTGAKDVNVSVQVTANSSGTTGVAGTPGTTGSSSSSVTDKTGDGQGDGGSCDPTTDFCGGPSSSGLYTKKNKTISDSLNTFKTGLMGSGIGSAMTGFFAVSVPGGSCPAWAVDVPVLNVHLDISQYFCTSTALSMMNLVGAVLMFVAAFVGFRWAIL
jgi:hypothetical protein